jgi:hypothetical protein
MELIVGHNGLNRLFGGGGGGAAPANISPDDDNGALNQVAPLDDGGQGLQPPADGGPGTRPQAGPPNGDGPQQAAGGGPQADGPQQGQDGGGAFSNETGQAGLTRFFEVPLAKEMSWLLPFALLGLGLAVFSAPIRFPLISKAHKAALLWGGWLVTCLVFFSIASFFHAYYMVMLAPALGAQVAVGARQLWRLAQERKLLAFGLLAVTSLVTIAFQTYLATTLSVTAWWLALPWLFFAASVIGLVLAALESSRWQRWAQGAFGLVLVAMLVIPAAWSGLTVADENASVGLPSAYSGAQLSQRGNAGEGESVNEDMLGYLEANTEGMTYLMAVPSSMQGSSYVIETGRGVLYMGGFNGGDPVVDAGDLAQLVDDGELRYVLSNGQGGRNGQSNVSTWLSTSCSVVVEYSQRAVANLNDADGGPQGAPGNQGPTILYDCGN